MESDTQPRRRISMWMVVTGIILMTVFIAIGGFAVWFRSDHDLKVADAAAKAAGVPATWTELGLVAAPPATLAALNRLDVLAMKLKSWQDSAPSGGAARKLEFGQPLPEGMAAHHAALPAAELAELLNVFDGLGENPPVRRISMNASSPFPEVTSWRYLCRLLGERVALASPQNLPVEAQRLVRAVQALPSPEVLMTHFVRISITAIAGQYLAYRLVDLRACQPKIPPALLSLADLLEANSRQCFTGEYLTMRETLSDRGHAGGLGFGSRIPFMAEGFIRAGRGVVLQDAQEWIRALQTPGDLRSMISLAKVNEAAFMKRRSAISPGDILLSILMPSRVSIAQRTASMTMRLRLLAAELDGTPWPEDVFAAPGTVLRRGERDGVLMFGYSVGKDGVDNGGNKKTDDCFPLYGPVEVPVVPAVTPTK